MVAGLVLLVEVLEVLMTQGGRIKGTILVGLVSLGLIGGWLLFDAFRRGFYLEVITRKRGEKLRFDRGLTRPELEEHLAGVRSRWGWMIDLSGLQ